jgi:hypothetical protein
MEFASFYNVDINRPKQTINFKTKANLQQPQRKASTTTATATGTATATATAAATATSANCKFH